MDELLLLALLGSAATAAGVTGPEEPTLPTLAPVLVRDSALVRKGVLRVRACVCARVQV